jgi:hypothetical protein
MKTALKIIVTTGLILGFIEPAFATASDKPTIVSFTMTPDTVDVATTNTVVTLTLVASNPTGIASTQTQATLSDGGNNTLVTRLVRTDSPVKSSLSTVTFLGTITIPSNLPAGAYFATANPIASLNADGTSGYTSPSLSATTTSKVVGAEEALLVRKSGDLNYDYSTFNGPAYDKTTGSIFINSKYNFVPAPIWKVGESVNVSDYFELTVPTLTLKIKANTPTICTSDNSTLKFIAVGGCSFTVYTDKTLDYRYEKLDQIVAISAARTKPMYTVGTIATQSSAALPLSIAGPFIYGPTGLVVPVSVTPSVCSTAGTYINVISGGTCTVNYSTPASSNYFASDVSSLSFEITRSAQTISFVAPSSVALSSKTLSLAATATSGLAVSFVSTTPSVCSVSGNSLNLLTSGTCGVQAVQLGSTTISPAVVTQSIAVTGILPSSKAGKAKSIICVKNGKSKTFTGSKCPAGFKAKK